MPGTPGEQAAFTRGETAGNISARLAAHDHHFEAINGSIGRLADGVDLLNMKLQRVIDNATANEVKVVATAAALKEAEVARREKQEIAWSPFAKMIAVITVLIAVTSLGLGVYIALKGGG